MRQLTVLLVLAVSAPVLAKPLTQAQISCAISKVPAGTGDGIAAAMVADDRRAMAPFTRRLGALVEACVRSGQIPEDKGEDYYDYVLARTPRVALEGQLRKAGVPVPGVIGLQDSEDAAGRSDGSITAMLADGGFDEAKLGDATWQKLYTFVDLLRRERKYLAALQ